jgi:anti-sigma B factor antagonist
MSVTFTEEQLTDTIRKISLDGTLDAPSAMSIEDEFKAILMAKSSQVIVDLNNIDYMSSYGLRMLLVGAKTLNSKGGGLHLVAPNEHVMKVITVAGYDQMFPVYETLEDALQALGQ